MKTIIDVREPAEFQGSHVKSAINLPLSTLSTQTRALQDISKDAEIIVYCRAGGRAAAAQQILLSAGFTDVTNGINQSNVESTIS